MLMFSGQRLTIFVILKEVSERKAKMEVYRGNVAKVGNSICSLICLDKDFLNTLTSTLENLLI